MVVNAAAEKNIEDPTFTSINFLLSHSLKTAIEESMDRENEGVIFEFARR